MTDINKEALVRDFTEAQIKQRRSRGNTMLSYVETPDYIRRLNEAFDYNWSFEIVEHRMEDGFIIITGKLSAAGITKMQFGGKDITVGKESGSILALDDDYKAAVSDCIKKCASLFGIGLHLYSDQDGKPPTTGAKSNSNNKPPTTGANSNSNVKPPATEARSNPRNDHQGTQKQESGMTWLKLENFAKSIGIASDTLWDVCLSTWAQDNTTNEKPIIYDKVKYSTVQLTNFSNYINNMPCINSPYLVECLVGYLNVSEWKTVDNNAFKAWLFTQTKKRNLEELTIAELLKVLGLLKSQATKKGAPVTLPANPARG